MDSDGRCPEKLERLVPGDAAWKQAVEGFNNGNYKQATFSFGLMLSEQTLTVATLGMGTVATTGVKVASSFAAEGAAIEDTIFTSWNEFQTGTRGQFASRAEVGAAWKNYKQGMAAEIENIKGSPIFLKKNQYINRVWDSRWMPGSTFSGPFGGSYSPNGALPITSTTAVESRGLNIPSVLNNAERGGVFNLNRNIPASLRTSIGGTEPELLIAPKYRQYLNLLDESISNLPTLN